MLDEREEHRVARAARHRQVDRVALARAAADVGRRPGARDTAATGGSSRTARRRARGRSSFVPLPWWTSQSKISTRCAPWASIACCARDRDVAEQAEAHRLRRARRGGPAGGAARPRRPAPSPPEQQRRPARTAPPAACSAASNEPGLTSVSRSIIPPPRRHSRSMRSTCSRRVDAARSARASRPATGARPSPASRARSARARSRRSARAFSGCAPVSCSSDDGWRSRTGAAIRIRYPAGARRTGDQQRPRGRRRRRRRPVRRAQRGRARAPRVVLVSRHAAGADRELLGAGRDRGRARGRGLPEQPPRRHRGGRAATLVRRSARAGARPRGARRACATSSELGVRFDADRRGVLALGLEGGHSRAPRRARRRQRDRPARRAPALGARRRRAAHRRCSRARARRAPGCATAAASASCSRTAARSAPARRSSPPAAPPRCGRARRTRRARSASGMSLAHAAGAELADLEFLQFHPTAVIGVAGREGFLVTEAIRGEGATLHGPDGERFVEELAPRDEVARAIAALLQRDRRDLRRPRHARRRPGAVSRTSSRRCTTPGLDPTRERIPVSPASHYMMGGVVTDLHGRSTVPGLLRRRRDRLHRPARRQPPGLQLAERVLRLRRARRRRRRSTSPPAPAPPGAPPPAAAARAPGARDAGGALARRRHRAHARRASSACSTIPTRSPGSIAACALRREESRGAHQRTDFPALDPGARPPPHGDRRRRAAASGTLELTAPSRLNTNSTLGSFLPSHGRARLPRPGRSPRKGDPEPHVPVQSRDLPRAVAAHRRRAGRARRSRGGAARLRGARSSGSPPTATTSPSPPARSSTTSARTSRSACSRASGASSRPTSAPPRSGSPASRSTATTSTATRSSAAPRRAAGRPCQRMPLAHNGYCPSHQHLAETEELELERSIAA